MRKHFCVLTAFILMYCCALELNGQEDQTLNNLTDLFYQNKAAFKDQKFNNQYYVNLQFERLPKRAEVEALKKEGVQLLSYQSNRTYQAILPANIKRSTLEQLGIKSINKQATVNKLSAAIRYSDFPDYAVEEEGTVDIALVFHEQIEQKSIEQFCRQKGIEILMDRMRGGKTIVARVAQDQLEQLAKSPIVAFVDVKGPEVGKLNFECRTNQKVNTLQSGISGDRNLDGEGVVIGVGDGGELGGHIDFDDRVINKANGTYSSFGDHGDHVAGIIGGAGHINPRHKGMAPASTIITQKTGSITFYAADYLAEHGMVLTNNSYGTSYNCELSGTYNYTSQNLDWQMRTMPKMLHVFAAGNSGRKTCGGYPKGYHTVLRFYQSAKNVLTVGNVDQNRIIYKNSSRGPVSDGRIKPEICGIGANVYSTGNLYNYKKKAGTSMSSPAVVGSLGLLYQQYRNLNNGETPDAALIKAIACNSAEDMGNVGPDYIYGFGLLNARNAVETLEAGNYNSGELDHGTTTVDTINVPSGVAQLKVMLYWHDKEAEAEAEKALINDLDLRVINPSQETFLPWVLNSDTLGVTDLATRKIDTLNNIEQITIDLPEAGAYIFEVEGTEIAVGPQKYYLTYEFVQSEVQLTYPYGKEKLQPTTDEYIQWEAEVGNSRNFKLEYSLDNGDSWTMITDTIHPETRSYLWNIPNVATEVGKIKITKVGLAQEDENVVPFSILPIVTQFVPQPKCEGILEFSWDKSPLTNIEGYELCYFDGVEMKPLVTTLDTFYSIDDSDFELGELYWFSVRIKLTSGEYTQRVVAESCIPQSLGICPWENDARLKQVFIKGTGRAMTSSQFSNNEKIQIAVMNVGTNPINTIPISYQVNGGSIITETINQNIEPGDSIVYEFDNDANMNEPGAYGIDAWINMNEDTHNSNDSIVDFPDVIHLPNEPIEISVNQTVREDFSTAYPQHYSNSIMGLTGILNWDYQTTADASARLEVDRINEALKLYPLVKEIDSNYENSLIWTINLDNYDETQGDLVLEMSYLNDTIVPLSTVIPSNNKIFVRGSDTDEWLDLYTMVISNGSEWQTVEDLNIYFTLLAGGQLPSTSTQIKFSQNDEFGFTLDNLGLSVVLNLPVNLTSFTAHKMEEDVLLKWDTASELNNDYFEIEVAIGEENVQNNRFNTIGRVEGYGSTSEANSYKFVDGSRNKKGNRYYRLKQYDFDGRFTYSPVRLVNFTSVIDQPILAYPNPFTDQLNVRYSSETEKTINLFLVDTQGRIIQQYQKEVKNGEQELILDIENGLASGVYFLRLADANKVQTIRLTRIQP